eukprot:CAMPEP_0202966206 /NCGR_PEP_ID=MMETSP1396-20130829/10515_1 /ASSEMBLY_ACC=CAM_ASM_000872 /TAXON_ID= /ORGANISM="Pseudokeronopsis sp., Strain Brazil" /LENGTH=38 /DNA_ID= /DNA_START= /DNA_END= /DNA_ORIENTATION=
MTINEKIEANDEEEDVFKRQIAEFELENDLMELKVVKM